MKFKQTLIVFVAICLPIISVADCYTSLRQKAIEAYNRGEYDRAKSTFQSAKEDCPDTPSNNDIDSWIQKCNSAKSRTRTFKANGQQFNMIFVEGGTFIMGATQGQTQSKMSLPVHEVELTSYYIAEKEVTQALWYAIMGTTLRDLRTLNCGNDYADKDDNKPNQPMTYMSWPECQEFCRRLNAILSEQLEGWSFAIPTEAQWEYAARGGKYSRNYKYSGSNNISEVGWTNLSISSDHIRAVGQKKANELGIYDMSGNASEWCYDWWLDHYPSAGRTFNPTGPTSGNGHVTRGGAWFQYQAGEVSSRSWEYDYQGKPARSSWVGLRLALVKK